MARKTRQVETRMVAEYVKQNYGKFPSIVGQPLGSIPVELLAQYGYEKALGIMRPYRPEADAIVILPNHLLLIEAKVWQILFGLSKLPFYKSLVPVTPELKEYLPVGEFVSPECLQKWDAVYASYVAQVVALCDTYGVTVPAIPRVAGPEYVIMELVVGWTNTNLELMAREDGIAVKVFCPDWLNEVVQSRQKYWTTEYRQKREQTLALRDYFGVE